jgi:hypothetical protein
VDIRSDTEIRAVPPNFSSAGRQKVSIANALGLDRSRAELVVRTKPAYAYAALAADIGIQATHVVYDAERDAVFSGRPYSLAGFGGGLQPASTITRFSYDSVGGNWSATTTSSFSSLLDIAMSPDGTELLVLSLSKLYRVDPVTLATNSSTDLPAGAQLGNARQLAVANDGKVIIRDLKKTYSLITNSFSPLSFPTPTVGIDMSPDGSRAAMGEATNQGDVPLSYYNASTGTIQVTTAFQYYSPGSFSRTASKLLSGNIVRDSNFSVIGELPVLADVLSPDGNRVYVYDYSLKKVHVFDVSGGGPSFPELASITQPPSDYPGVNRAALSLDSQTLFLVGEAKFIVQPVP